MAINIIGNADIIFNVLHYVPCLILTLRVLLEFSKIEFSMIPNFLSSEIQDLNGSERVKVTDHTKSFMLVNNSRLFLKKKKKKMFPESLTSGKAGCCEF